MGASTCRFRSVPVLARDETTGTIYFATLNFSGSNLRLFRSYDNGLNFAAPVGSAPGFGGGDFLDKEWIAVDNFPGVGRGNVYQTFRNFPGFGQGSLAAGIYFTRSTDGGGTWTPNGGTSIIGSNGVQGAFVVVGTDHSVCVFWYDQSNGGGTQGRIRMRRSTDHGVTFAAAITEGVVQAHRCRAGMFAHWHLLPWCAII